MRIRIWALLMAVIVAGCTQEHPPTEGPPVGMQRLSLEDPERLAWDGDRHRPLATFVWYPAPDGTAMAEVVVPAQRPVFFGGHAARNAPLAEGGPYPLVLLSHGTGGSAFQMMWLGRALAARGYITAAVDHHGNTAAEEAFDARGFRMPWLRAQDLSAVLDQLLSHDTFGPRIDPDRIAAAGFSLGGYTAMTLAGARSDLARFEAFCAGPDRDRTCDAQAEYPEADTAFAALRAVDPSLETAIARHGDDFGDARVKAIVALAPALAAMLTDESLAAIDAPVLIIAGDADTVTPVRTNAARLLNTLPNAQMEILQGATHYGFLNTCTARGRRFVPVCADDPAMPRADVHDQAIAFIETHLRRSLTP